MKIVGISFGIFFIISGFTSFVNSYEGTITLYMIFNSFFAWSLGAIILYFCLRKKINKNLQDSVVLSEQDKRNNFDNRIENDQFSEDDILYGDNYGWEDETFRELGHIYYDHMQKIEAMWSVLYNLNLYNSDQANSFELKCRENINDWLAYKTYDLKQNYNIIYDIHTVPAFKRLAMLYERQGKYDKAAEICLEAIKSEAYQDGTSSTMYGRLARMIKKGKLTPTEEMAVYLINNVTNNKE